jgi:hypothetical protein
LIVSKQRKSTVFINAIEGNEKHTYCKKMETNHVGKIERKNEKQAERGRLKRKRRFTATELERKGRYTDTPKDRREVKTDG